MCNAVDLDDLYLEMGRREYYLTMGVRKMTHEMKVIFVLLVVALIFHVNIKNIKQNADSSIP